MAFISRTNKQEIIACCYRLRFLKEIECGDFYKNMWMSKAYASVDYSLQDGTINTFTEKLKDLRSVAAKTMNLCTSNRIDVDVVC